MRGFNFYTFDFPFINVKFGTVFDYELVERESFVDISTCFMYFIDNMESVVSWY